VFTTDIGPGARIRGEKALRNSLKKRKEPRLSNNDDKSYCAAVSEAQLQAEVGNRSCHNALWSG
jgi:hypothetical protein